MKLAFINLLPILINNKVNTKMIINNNKNTVSDIFCKYDYECQLPNTCIIIAAGYGVCGYNKKRTLIPILVPIPVDK